MSLETSLSLSVKQVFVCVHTAGKVTWLLQFAEITQEVNNFLPPDSMVSNFQRCVSK